MNILVVEDDRGIVSFLTKGLKAEGYAVTVAHDGDAAIELVETAGSETDLVLLDLGLPGTDGRTVLRTIRSQHPSLPVIILTARDAVDDKVWGLDAGASDYVTKPFSFDELLARIRVALRAGGHDGASRLAAGDLRMDLVGRVAWRDGRRIDLSPREWALLELFLRHPHQVLSRAQILSRVWEFDFDPGSNVVDVYVGYLRRKINTPDRAPLLRTVRGVGYRLLDPETSTPAGVADAAG